MLKHVLKCTDKGKVMSCCFFVGHGGVRLVGGRFYSVSPSSLGGIGGQVYAPAILLPIR